MYLTVSLARYLDNSSIVLSKNPLPSCCELCSSCSSVLEKGSRLRIVLPCHLPLKLLALVDADQGSCPDTSSLVETMYRVLAWVLRNYRSTGLVMAVEAEKITAFRQELASLINET
ncbi:hypothetical protein CR513_34883, partial [Mucuna pruriens]